MGGAEGGMCAPEAAASGGVGGGVEGGLQVGQRLGAVLRQRLLPRHELAVRLPHRGLLLRCQTHRPLHAAEGAQTVRPCSL